MRFEALRERLRRVLNKNSMNIEGKQVKLAPRHGRIGRDQDRAAPGD